MVTAQGCPVGFVRPGIRDHRPLQTAAALTRRSAGGPAGDAGLPLLGRVLKQKSGRLPAGKLFPVRGQGLPLWAGSGNATRVSCTPAQRSSKDPCCPHQQRPVPGPAGGKRPPGAGRALAGGFGRRLAWIQPRAAAGAMAPARMRKAHRRKRFPLSGQAAHAVGTFSASCQAPLRGLLPPREPSGPHQAACHRTHGLPPKAVSPQGPARISRP